MNVNNQGFGFMVSYKAYMALYRNLCDSGGILVQGNLKPQGSYKSHMSHSLNSLKGVIQLYRGLKEVI